MNNDFFLKRVIILNYLLLFSFLSFSQGVAINSNGAINDPSALLDLQSDTVNNPQGILIPRMSTVKRNAIVNPAEGLMIFNISTKCFETYINPMWQTMFCGCNMPISPLSGNHTPSQNEIIWNWNHAQGALGYKYNTINDYLTATDNGLNTSYTQTSLNCLTPYTLYVWAYNACGNSNSTILTQTTSLCGPPPCNWNGSNTFTVSHTAGSVSPVTKTNLIYAQTQTNISGSSKCWITQNLGADNQASSASDPSESASGWYWQYNRKQGYQFTTTRTPTNTWTALTSASDWSAANDPCTLELGANWRIPTQTEWSNANTNGTWNNFNDTYSSELKLHAAGYLYDYSGPESSRGDIGRYWSNSQSSSFNGWYIAFSNSLSEMSYTNTASGYTVRCIRD